MLQPDLNERHATLSPCSKQQAAADAVSMFQSSTVWPRKDSQAGVDNLVTQLGANNSKHASLLLIIMGLCPHMTHPCNCQTVATIFITK